MENAYSSKNLTDKLTRDVQKVYDQNIDYINKICSVYYELKTFIGVCAYEKFKNNNINR